MADSSLESPPNGSCLFRCFFVVLTFWGREAAIQLEGKRKVAPYLVAPSRRRARNPVQIVVFVGPLLETAVPSRRNCSLKAKLSVSIVFLSPPPSTFLPSRWKAGSHCFFRRTGFCRRTPFMNNRLRCFFVVRFFCVCGRGKGAENQMEGKRKGSLFLVAPRSRRPWTTVQIVVFVGGPP